MMALDSPATWNSLEIVKLVTSTLTPLALVGLGVYVQRVSKRFENRQWVNQKLVEKRMLIYDQIAPCLNDVLCYFTFVGRWRELDPPEMLRIKRELDKKIYLAAPLFPPPFFKACMAFQHECFQMYVEWGKSAQLRTPTMERRKAHIRPWDEAWSNMFCESCADPRKIQQLYLEVMREFSHSFGEMEFDLSDTSSRIPKNIR